MGRKRRAGNAAVAKTNGSHDDDDRDRDWRKGASVKAVNTWDDMDKDSEDECE